MTPNWTIIADDLTGAGDCAAAFARCGYSSIIWLHGHKAAEPCDVPVMETASRHVAPEEAYRRVHAVALKAAGHLFKKLDSTLHGNLGPEIRAVHEAAGGREVLVVPSHPVMGRIMKDGVLYVHGQPADPPRHLPSLLKEQGLTEGFRIADCESLADLQRITAELLAQPGRLAVAGAGALAEAIAESLPGAGPVAESPSVDSLLVVAGSNNVATRQQLALLKGAAEVPVLYVDRREYASAAVLAPVHSPDAMLICGGDTARAVAKFLGASGIRILGEAARGVPWGRWVGGASHGKPVATKAGGFGGPDTLVEAVLFLRRHV
jgi:D-threonate/D-erythronate kinase